MSLSLKGLAAAAGSAGLPQPFGEVPACSGFKVKWSVAARMLFVDVCILTVM